jgi:hypothetical protein
MRDQRRRGPEVQVAEEQSKLLVGGEMRVKQSLRSSTALLHEIDPVVSFGCLGEDWRPRRGRLSEVVRTLRIWEDDSRVGDGRSRLVSALVPSDIEGISTLSSRYRSKGGKTGQARALRSGALGHFSKGDNSGDREDGERGDIVSRIRAGWQ